MEASLTKDGPRFTTKFERRLAHAPEKVWRVLTERELLKKWFPADVVGEWKVGAKLQCVFAGGEGDGLTEEEMRGEVVSMEPPRLLEFSWGENLFRCELIAEGDGCTFLFSDTFEDGSVAARNAAGWEGCLAVLETLLDGGVPEAFALDAWRVPFKRYVERFEKLAGPQQGPPETHPEVVAEKADEGPGG